MGFKEKEIINNNREDIVIDKLKKINDYTKTLTAHENPQLIEIYEAEKKKDKLSPIIEPEVGKFLSFLVRSLKAKYVLELGSGIGYSTIWLGEALNFNRGKLISVEVEENKYREAALNIKKAALDHVVKLINQDALSYLNSLNNDDSKFSFDLIFVDLDKRLYPEIVENCIGLLKVNGLIVADDTLFKPKGLRKKISEPVHRFNEIVFSHSRLYSVILPVGDGITMSLKIK